jgi:autotransporter adhesin
MGIGNTVTGDTNSVIGFGHTVTGNRNAIFGDPNTVTGDDNLVFANDAIVQGDRNVALGNDAVVTGNDAIAIGTGATATGDSGVAIGTGATATGNGVAIGSGSVAGDGELNVGNRRITGVAAGIADTDIANIGQLKEVRDQVTGLDGRVTRVETRLQNEIDEVGEKAYRGIAIANAMEVFLPDPGKSFRLNIGGGYYENEGAIGITGAGRITEDTSLYLGIGTDVDGKKVGGKVGVSFQW